ncbi:protein-glutamate O-methyltransferase CheR [Clostridium sp. SHJSY1]|uniref:CheR family methyltransferase n=1 Tax=Clostridium sp. SHJSY1 TaxID=2942483 RepID=UPI00287534E0|nr:protein-glutamate O-methyltransferase CheR [Clostridium sp. SHJSY1]MDS0524644.1 protein-glutamate O-methyltransferase CheR [Clostridium sp. SHJSY1]
MINITQKEYSQLASFIKDNYGIDLGTKKQALVLGRLTNVLVEQNIDCFSDYFKYITSDKTGNAVETLVNKITTNHTFFMRESDHFTYFKDIILPYLKNNQKQKDLRIWSAGCSSGEEPYTIAMIIDEFFGKDKVLWDTKILATDISTKVLDIAIKGEYQNEAVDSLSSSWQMNYFNKIDIEKSVVNNKIKNEVIFRRFNLMNEVFPFKQKFNVIFCRNVMIYFDNETKDNLINKFYDLLDYGGYLFIGHSEYLNRDKSKFEYVKPAIYRKE